MSVLDIRKGFHFHFHFVAVTFPFDLLPFLCSVLVHSGGVHGGHYYAFIRPTLSDQWYADTI